MDEQTNICWSNYNIDEKFNDFHVIFNTKTSAIIKIDNNTYNQIQQLIQSNNNKFDNDNISLLLKKGFLITCNNEFLKVKERYLKHYYDINRLNLTILPAEYCNLVCPYCFIYNYGGFRLSDTLQNNIISFIKTQILKSDLEKPFYARINWYGGEPLLEKERILNMMKEINSFILSQNKTRTNRKIILESSIITNGVLLSPSVFLDLLNNQIKIFQITFDGGKEFHDKTRSSKNGTGSFDKILNNLKSIISLSLDEKFAFSIRINFMKNSLNSVFPLIDLLSEIVGDDKRFMIYCRPVYNFETARDSISTVESNIYSLDEGLKIQEQLAQYISKKLNKNTEASLLDSLIPFTRYSWCFEDNNYSFIIGANSDIYKCDTLIGEKKFSIGKINDDGEITDNSNSFWMKNIFELKEFEKCWNCKLLPICFGGCKRNKLEGNNDCFLTEKLIRNNIREYIEKGGEK